jgi:hypothetical protein
MLVIAQQVPLPAVLSAARGPAATSCIFAVGLGKQHRDVQTRAVALGRSRLRAPSAEERGAVLNQPVACTAANAMSTVRCKVQSMQMSKDWKQVVARTACAPPPSSSRSCHRDLRLTWRLPLDMDTATFVWTSMV